jgi:hypothetical protein
MYPELLNNLFFPLADNVNQILSSNGKMYIRAYNEQVLVMFKEANDTSFARIAIIPANTGQLLDSIFPTKNSTIKVTGGSAYLKLFKD